MALIAERYQLIEKLGQGGMGEVYRGLDTLTQQPVAIKNLHSTISADADVLERFRREGAALRELNHPNIVKMLDMIQDDGAHYLIMEYIDGGDLAGLLKSRGKLPVNEAVKLALELADALSRAQHLGIIHRDIKPANVLIARDGTPRLTDFGVARIETEERLTGTGMAVGTMDYMPPEAVNGEPVDMRGDIWAFGVMLYEMLTGERPFTGETTLVLLTNILTIPVPDITRKCPGAPPSLQALILQMLQKDREIRLRSSRQLGAALEAILHGETVNLQQLDTPPKPTSTPTKAITDAPADIRTASLPLSSVPLVATRRLPVWLFPAAAILIVIVGAALVNIGTLLPTVATPTAIATETAMPTATTAPLTAEEPAPEGYQWVNVEEVRLPVPAGWTSLDLAGVITLVHESLVDDEIRSKFSAGIAYLEQQRAFSSYNNWLMMQGVAVMIEDTGIILSAEARSQRIRELAASVGFPVATTETLQLAGGTALRFVIPAELNGLPMEMIIYAFQHDATQYLFYFASRKDKMDEMQLIIDTVIANFHISTGVDATPPGATPAPGSIPEGWKAVTEDGFSVAIPPDWITLAANDLLIASVIAISFPDMDSATTQRLKDVIAQFDVRLVFSSGSGTVPVAGSIWTIETSLSLNTDYFEGIVLAMSGEFNVNAETRIREDINLPGGRARYLVIHIPSVREESGSEVLFYIINTPDGFYVLSLLMPASEHEAIAPVFARMAETFRATP